MDYSLFIMVMMVEMLEKVEIPPAAAPKEFPPPIFATLSSRKLWEVLYIGVLGQKKSVGERIKQIG